MQKKLSKARREQIKSIIVLCSIVAVIVIGVAASVVPRMTMHNSIKELVQNCEAGNTVTDFSARTEDAFTVSNGYFSVDIAKEFKQDTSAANPMLDLYLSGEKSMAIFKEPGVMQISLTNPLDKDSIGAGVETGKLEEMVAKLGYGTPDCYYNIMKAVILLDKEDYSIWDKEVQVGFAVVANLKERAYTGRQLWVYERGEVCAIVSQYEGTQNFVVEMVRTQSLKQVFSMYLNNVQEEEVWKLLNSVEFQ